MDTIHEPNIKKNPTVVQLAAFPSAQYAPFVLLSDSFICGASRGFKPKKNEFAISAMFSMKMYRWYVESNFGTDIRTTTTAAKTDRREVIICMQNRGAYFVRDVDKILV
mmetsp:Transcript_4544/g.11727  ORF Transcript_4544/g.11727 Transcript_4544/m.11727 type:complete len:109 (-) Transcript_4544:70-396(-)